MSFKIQHHHQGNVNLLIQILIQKSTFLVRNSSFCNSKELIELLAEIQSRSLGLHEKSIAFLFFSLPKIFQKQSISNLSKERYEIVDRIISMILDLFMTKNREFLHRTINEFMMLDLDFWFPLLKHQSWEMKLDFVGFLIRSKEFLNLQSFFDAFLANESSCDLLVGFVEGFTEAFFTKRTSPLAIASLETEVQLRLLKFYFGFLERMFRERQITSCKVILTLLKYWIEQRRFCNFPTEARQNTLFEIFLRLFEVTFQQVFQGDEKVKNEFCMRIYFLLPTKKSISLHHESNQIENFLSFSSMFIKFSSIRRCDIAKAIENCLDLPLAPEQIQKEIFLIYLRYLKENCIYSDFGLFWEKLSRLTSTAIKSFIERETELKSKNVCPPYYLSLAKEKSSDWITLEEQKKASLEQESLSQTIIQLLKTIQELILFFARWNPLQVTKLFDACWLVCLESTSMLRQSVKHASFQMVFSLLEFLHFEKIPKPDEFQLEDEMQQIDSFALHPLIKNTLIPTFKSIIPIRQKITSSKMVIVEEQYRISKESWLLALESFVLSLAILNDENLLQSHIKLYGMGSFWVTKNFFSFESRIISLYFVIFLCKYSLDFEMKDPSQQSKANLLALVEHSSHFIELIFPSNISIADSQREKEEIFRFHCNRLLKEKGKKDFNEFFHIITGVIKKNFKDFPPRTESGIKYLHDCYHLLGCLIQEYAESLYESNSVICTLPSILKDFFSFRIIESNYQSFIEFNHFLTELSIKYSPCVLVCLSQLDFSGDSYVKKQFSSAFNEYLANLSCSSAFALEDSFVCCSLWSEYQLLKLVKFLFCTCYSLFSQFKFYALSCILCVLYSIVSQRLHASLWYCFLEEFSHKVILHYSISSISFAFYKQFPFDYLFALNSLAIDALNGGSSLLKLSIEVLFGLFLEDFNVPLQLEGLYFEWEIQHFIPEHLSSGDSFSVSIEDSFGIRRIFNNLKLVEEIFSFWRSIYLKSNPQEKRRLYHLGQQIMLYLDNFPNHLYRSKFIQNFFLLFQSGEALIAFAEELFI